MLLRVPIPELSTLREFLCKKGMKSVSKAGIHTLNYCLTITSGEGYLRVEVTLGRLHELTRSGRERRGETAVDGEGDSIHLKIGASHPKGIKMIARNGGRTGENRSLSSRRTERGR